MGQSEIKLSSKPKSRFAGFFSLYKAKVALRQKALKCDLNSLYPISFSEIQRQRSRAWRNCVKENYYNSLLWSLNRIAGSLPASLEGAERQAALQKISALQRLIQVQIGELAYNDPRNPGL